MEKLHTTDVLENHLKDRLFHLFIGWVSSYLCEGRSRIHQLERKFYLDCSSDTHCTRGIWKGDVLISDIRGVGNDGRIWNLLEKTQWERGDISQRKWKIHFSSRRWTNQTFWRRSRPENIHLGTASTNPRRESNIDFLGESEGSLPREAINHFWSMSGNFTHRHQVEPRVKLYSPRDESFPIPLKYIDVSRTAHTNLDGQGDGVPKACL